MEHRTTPPPSVIDESKKYSVTVHTSRGDFVIALVQPKVAPETVNNFVYLAKNNFYEGLTFHRVVPGFVVQGGDPLGDGTGGPAYKLPDESNPSEWPRGPVGMAASVSPGADDFNTCNTAKGVTYPDGLQIADLKVGTGDTASKGENTEVQYSGWLTDGHLFDSSRQAGRGSFTIQIGVGQVITGWDEGVPGMKVGGKRCLKIPGALAYGAQGQTVQTTWRVSRRPWPSCPTSDCWLRSARVSRRRTPARASHWNKSSRAGAGGDPRSMACRDHAIGKT